MHISVQLFLHLKKYASTSDGAVRLNVSETTTVEMVLDKLGIPSETKKIVLVDGKHSRPSQALQDGQTLTVYPPLDGG